MYYSLWGNDNRCRDAIIDFTQNVGFAGILRQHIILHTPYIVLKPLCVLKVMPKMNE